ncbi:outer membrane beta-barrel protein [Flaviaesturariibacter amylovorans]|uniref:Outer membrane protein beta-barrel domain-containing protein n=1 Tax=Flaviaesturariibacter amylovorans TaxID=1084520 RepID=A0ABP8GX53_9BACT
MKKVVLSFAIAAIALGANAQKGEGFQFSAGIKPSLPLGDLSEAYSFGIGAEVGGEYHFAEKVSGIATISYNQFLGSEDKNGGLKTSMLPILAGVRFYPSQNVFIGAKVGVNMLRVSMDGFSASTSGLGYEPHVGYNAEKFQISAGYLGLSKDGASMSALTLTAAFKF